MAGACRMVVKAAWPVQAPAGLPDWLSISWGAGEADHQPGACQARGPRRGSERHPQAVLRGQRERTVTKALPGPSGGAPWTKDTLKSCLRPARTFPPGSAGTAWGSQRRTGISGRLTAVASLVALRDHICSLTFNIRYPITMKETAWLKIGATAAGLDMEVASCSGKAPVFPLQAPHDQSLMNTYNEFLGRDEAVHHGENHASCFERLRLRLPAGAGRLRTQGPHSEGTAVPIPPTGGARGLYKRQLTLFILSLAEGQKVELS